MAAIVYRSVRIVIQNSTNTLWTLDSAEVICGEWAGRGGLPDDIRQIDPQSAAAFTAQSTQLHVGVEGFIRYGSVHGPFHVHWSRPWVGDFDLRYGLADGAFSVVPSVNEDNPAFPAVLLTVSRNCEGG